MNNHSSSDVFFWCAYYFTNQRPTCSGTCELPGNTYLTWHAIQAALSFKLGQIEFWAAAKGVKCPISVPAIWAAIIHKVGPVTALQLSSIFFSLLWQLNDGWRWVPWFARRLQSSRQEYVPLWPATTTLLFSSWRGGRTGTNTCNNILKSWINAPSRLQDLVAFHFFRQSSHELV